MENVGENRGKTKHLPNNSFYNGKQMGSKPSIQKKRN